ncbi:MAG: carboxymuconolactone decarboxylase family protein [Thermocrispum sp.]
MTSARIAPATRREMGLVNSAITGVLGAAAGTGPPNLFTTLARHRRMFRPWLRFAATLMPAGVLPRRDTELVILRVAHLCECAYEWQHHLRLARAAGFTEAQLDAVRGSQDNPLWTPRQRLLLEAADELHATRTCSPATWQRLRTELGERELIELPMLVGHYEMLATTINTLRIQPDAPRRATGLCRVCPTRDRVVRAKMAPGGVGRHGLARGVRAVTARVTGRAA